MPVLPDAQCLCIHLILRYAYKQHILMHVLMPAEVQPMRTTLNIDDQLYEEAVRLTGVKEKTALLRESLKALIQRESARRLARLGGSEPQLDDIPRRRNDGQ